METSPREGQDGFINHAETGRIGFIMDKLRAPPVVENDGVAPNFDGKPRIPLLWQDRSGDQALGTRVQLRPGFTTEKRDTCCGDTDINEDHAVHGFDGHE